jgi:hypothetical protein
MRAKLCLAVVLAAVASISSGAERCAEVKNSATRIEPNATEAVQLATPSTLRAAPPGMAAASMPRAPREVKDDANLLCACVRRRDHA